MLDDLTKEGKYQDMKKKHRIEKRRESDPSRPVLGQICNNECYKKISAH